MDVIHGYVLALYDGNDGKTCLWGPTDIDVDTEQLGSGTHFCGYGNTQKIKDKAGKKLLEDFPAAYYASVGYEEKHPSPRNSSGWFLPSVGQCLYWFSQSESLRTSMDKVVKGGWQDYYWSSSEDSDNSKYYAWYVSFSYGEVYNSRVYFGNKAGANHNSVRPCLAF